jgi:hypothetical protein
VGLFLATTIETPPYETHLLTGSNVLVDWVNKKKPSNTAASRHSQWLGFRVVRGSETARNGSSRNVWGILWGLWYISEGRAGHRRPILMAKKPFQPLKGYVYPIINEVRGVNRVVYDISSKPPATIEWE